MYLRVSRYNRKAIISKKTPHASYHWNTSPGEPARSVKSSRLLRESERSVRVVCSPSVH